MSSASSKITASGPLVPTDDEVLAAILALRSDLKNIYSGERHAKAISVENGSYSLKPGTQASRACKFCSTTFENRYELLKHLHTHRIYDAPDDLEKYVLPCFFCVDKYAYAWVSLDETVTDEDDPRRKLRMHKLIHHARAAISLSPEFAQPASDAMETSP